MAKENVSFKINKDKIEAPEAKKSWILIYKKMKAGDSIDFYKKRQALSFLSAIRTHHANLDEAVPFRLMMRRIYSREFNKPNICRVWILNKD